MNDLFHQLAASPATSFAVTLGAFLLGQWLYKKFNGHSLANPIVIAITGVVAFIRFSGISYESYMKGAAPIHILLGPATVALAIPLYRQFARVRQTPAAISLAVLTTVITSSGVSILLARQLGAPQELQLAIMLKSVSTPIAIGIAEKIHAVPSLAVLFVFSTGIFGSLIATLMFKSMRLTDDKAIGLSLGATCHGLGVALALQRNEVAGAFAVLGMGLMGVFSAFVLPAVILYFLHAQIL